MTTQEVVVRDPFQAVIQTPVDTRFWNFHQNNSGGHFDYSERKYSVYTIFEATSAEDAASRARAVGIYFDGCDLGWDCDCCGDRWYEPWDGGQTRDEMVQEVNQIISSEWSFKWLDEGTPEIILHMMDGTVYTAWETSMDRIEQ